MKKPFCPMVPAEAMLRDKSITPRLLRALLALYTFADQNGDCYPKRAQLAEMCGMREAEISRATTDLQRLGWLTKTGNGGRNTPARYRLHAPQTVQDSCTVSWQQTVQDSCRVSGQTVQKSCTVSEPETVQDSCIKTVQESCARIKHTNEHTKYHSRQAGVVSAPASAPAPAPAQEPEFALQGTPQRKPAKRVSIACPPDVKPDDWQELLAICKAKRKPMTARVWAGMVEAAKHDGMTLQEMVDFCIHKGWARYETGWKANEERKQNGGGYISAAQKAREERKEWVRKIFEPFTKEQNDAATVDAVKTTRRDSQLQLLECSK